MPKRATDAPAEPLGAGWTELRRGRWKAARGQFERALAESETAQGLEGLSWAAWWLDDAATVFEARERACRLYSEAGDAAAAARMATWLAIDHFDFNGALAVANGWLRRAHRLLDPLQPGPEHGWLAMQEGYLARVRGDAERALELARRTAELGRRFGVADLEMLGLALEGATRVDRAEVEAGMQCLDEATTLALEGEASIPISSAWACCFLVSACTAARDYERAFEWCDRIAEFAERYGSRYMLGFCRAEYGAVHLWRGRWGDAEAVLEASIEDFGRSRPAMAGGPRAALAELRRRQGRPREAEALLEDVGASAAAQLCRARLALDAGDPKRCAELCERALRQAAEDCPLDRAPGLELLVMAAIADRDLERAAGALAELRAVEQLAGTAPLRAAVDLAAGTLAAARGEHEDARARLEDAVDRFEAIGAPFEAARARLELAAALEAAGRSERAAREAEAAAERLAELGADLDAARARRLLRRVAEREGPGEAAVTPREREVLALLAEGLTNQQIAERLVVSEHTVHRHVTNILRKLELPTRSGAAAYAVRHGLHADRGE